MPTIIALNPRPKKGKKKKKKKRKMTALQLQYFGKGRKKKSKRKNKRKRPAMTALQKKYFGTKAQRKETGMAKAKTKKRKNPKKSKAIRRYTRQTLGGVNMMGAMRSTVPLLFGALVAKFAAKKFADGGAEGDNWTWKNYLLALAGGFTAAFLTSATLKKKAAAQKVFEGSLLLIAYKVFTNEIAPQNPSLESWFGGNEDNFDPYSGVGDNGDIWAGDNEDYVKGIDGYWRPASESHRLPPGRSMGDVMVPPDPRYGGMGDVMVPPDSRYGYGASNSEINQMIENDEM